MTNQKEKFTKGVFWNLVDVLSAQLIAFIVSVILARKLSPNDFGTVAIVISIISFISIFASGGLSEAMLIKKDFSKDTMNSVFMFNVLVSIFIYFLCFLVAPLIADFYHNHELKNIVRVLTFSVVITNSNNVHLGLLLKEVNFKKMFWLKLPGIIISGLTGIILAYMNYGVWALVLQMMTLSFLNSSITWWLMRKQFIPNFILKLSSLKHLFAYSGRMVASGTLNGIFVIFYPLFIGKQYSVQSLGFYNRGVSLKDLIVSNVVQVIAKVSLPVFSELTNDIPRLKNAYRNVMQATFFIIAPLMLGGMVVAYNLIYTVYTEKWTPAAPLFQMVCVLGFLYPFHYINLDILRVFSKSNLFFRLEVIKRILSVIAVVISYKYGVRGILLGEIIVSVIAVFVNSFYSGKLLNYSIAEQFKDLLAPVFVALIMAAIVYAVGKSEFKIPILLMIQLMVGVFTYLFFAFLFRMQIFFQLKNIALSKIQRSK